MSAMLPDKLQVLATLRTALTTELDTLESLAASSREEVTSDETRQEGQYDTRATEASYLARGQATRIAELRRLAAWVDVFDTAAPLDPPVAQVGALVQIEGERTDVLFIAPAGGNRLTVEGVTVRVISPASPLGAALADQGLEDAFEVQTPGGLAEFEIVAIR